MLATAGDTFRDLGAICAAFGAIIVAVGLVDRAKKQFLSQVR